MKKILISIFIIGFVAGSCGLGNKHDINVKRDFEYLYTVMEKSFLTVVKGIKKKKINKSLDAVAAYIKRESKNIEDVGTRLDSIILKEKESYEIIKYNEKYGVLTSKYTSFINLNLNSKQRDRFVTLIAEGVIKKMMDQLLQPKNSIDFFKYRSIER